MKTLAEFLPLTHAVNLSRAVFTGTYSNKLFVNIAVILVLEIAAFYAGIKMMKKRLIK
jgi:ABC-type polysaccharide/polyol phosphate export permease